MSDQGPVIVHDSGGGNATAFAIILILIVAVGFAAFAWHPWSTRSVTRQTTVTQPNNAGPGSSTTNSTTTTNGHP